MRLSSDTLAAPRSGFISSIETREVGLAALDLGAGRATKEDEIDPGVGLEICVRLGERVEAGQPLLYLHHAERGVEDCTRRLLSAYTIGEFACEPGPLVIDRVGG